MTPPNEKFVVLKILLFIRRDIIVITVILKDIRKVIDVILHMCDHPRKTFR